MSQIEEFVQFVESCVQNKRARRCSLLILTQIKKVGVHCFAGIGRTGTMLACFLAHHHDLDATTAIAKLRSMRPDSIDTESQAMAVVEYCALLARKRPGMP